MNKMKFKGIKGRWLLYLILISIYFYFTYPYIESLIIISKEVIVTVIYPWVIENPLGAIIIQQIIFHLTTLYLLYNQFPEYSVKFFALLSLLFLISLIWVKCRPIKNTLNFFDRHFSTGDYRK